MSQQQISRSKAVKDLYYKLKVHHLSYFLISLFKINDKPFGIQIEYVMENYLDTPTQKVAAVSTYPLAKHISLINMAKIENHDPAYIRTIKINTLTIGGNCETNQTRSCNKDIDSFDTSYATLAFNVRRILNLNKRYEEHKKVAKTARNRIDSKSTFKQQKKSIDKEKSECKKNIRDLMLEIYDR
jgi:hypothetical protein